MTDELKDFATKLVNTWIAYIETYGNLDSRKSDSDFRNILKSNLKQLEKVAEHYNGQGIVRVLVEMEPSSVKANLSDTSFLTSDRKFSRVLGSLIVVYATLHPDGPLSQKPSEVQGR